MNHEPSSFDAQALWQSQPAPRIVVSAAEMHARAAAFDRRIRRRNTIEYIASGFVIVIFCWYATFPEPATPLWPVANIAIALGTLLVMWNLHRISRSASAADVSSVTSLIEHHRADLLRHQKSLKSVWLWYIMPIVPGTLMWFVAQAIGRPSGAVALPFAIVFVTTAAVFIGVIVLNLRGAAKLQRMIDELDRYGE
jgi:hypothetical protein